MQEQVVAFSVSWEHSDPRLALQVGMLQHTAECALAVTFLQLSRGATEGRTPEVCYQLHSSLLLVHPCTFLCLLDPSRPGFEAHQLIRGPAHKWLPMFWGARLLVTC
jgi:hypothetical protein